MKRFVYCLVVLALVICSTACSSKIVVVHVPAGVSNTKLPADGIFYAVPRTVIAVDIPVELVDSEPGKYVDFAPVFFPDKRAVKAKGKRLKVKPAKFSTFGEPDPKAVYYVPISGSALVDWTRNFEFNEDGTITSGKEQADNQTADIAVGLVSTTASIAAKAIGAPEVAACADYSAARAVACYLERVDEGYRNNFMKLKSDNLDLFRRISKENTTKEEKYKIKTPSTLTTAVESVQKMSLLTKKREDLVTTPPPGVQLTDVVFSKIDGLIAERLKDFVGMETTSAWTGSFEARPSKITDVVTLFRVNPTRGLCVMADVGVKEEPPINFRYNYGSVTGSNPPVYCKEGGTELQDVRLRFSPVESGSDEMLRRIKNSYLVREDEDVSPITEERSFRFRIPASAKASVGTDAEGSVSSESRLLVGQFGLIVALPASLAGKSSMYSLKYYPSTGALKTFDASSKALLTKGTIDTLGGAAGSIVDAEKKAADARAKAADQLNQLDRKRAILEDEVKIQVACKQLNMDCSQP